MIGHPVGAGNAWQAEAVHRQSNVKRGPEIASPAGVFILSTPPLPIHLSRILEHHRMASRRHPTSRLVQMLLRPIRPVNQPQRDKRRRPERLSIRPLHQPSLLTIA